MATLKSISKFKPAAYNPRKIKPEALEALDKSIQEFGDLSGVVINKKTDTIVAGHQRIKTLNTKDTKVVTTKYKDKYGTVEQGHIEVRNGKDKFKIPLRIVNWDIRREKLANIAANNLGGEFDNQKLGKLLAELDEEEFDVELTGMTVEKVDTYIRRSKEEEGESDERYVKKLTSPIYEPTGKRPKLDDLFDNTKTIELQEEIDKVSMPEDLKHYLYAAAERHTKFRFDLAAEYYAHAPKKIQKLMEDSALVIVDFEKALEHGYLRMTEEIVDMMKNGQE